MPERDPASEWEVRALAGTDVPQVVAVHLRSFPDFFLTHLGPAFLRRFYAQFVDHDAHVGTVAVTDGRVVGFIVGTTDAPRLYHAFYRRHFPWIAGLTALRLLTDGYVRRHIVGRLSHVLRAVRALLPGAPRRPPARSSDVPNRLLSIAVDPDLRGRGVARRMLEHFCDQLRDRGCAAVGLTVRTSSHSAIRFYEKTGWQREAAGKDSIGFVLSISPEGHQDSDRSG
jgi:ribosomal protein S18 acetylase RimI-like enzyme